MERTFVAIKPDAVQRGFIGKIITRFEDTGFKIVALKMIHTDKPIAQKHYEEHIGKPFFESLVSFITSGPIVAMVIEGENAVKVARKIIGATNPQEAEPGTIRADYGQVKSRNIVHGSDSIENAKREIGIFFKPEEIVETFNRSNDIWIYE